MVSEWPLRPKRSLLYSHLAGILPRVLHEEVDYHQQKYSVEDLIDEKQRALTRAAVFAVGGLATRVPTQVKSALASLLGLRLGSKECFHVLDQLGEQSQFRQGVSEVELRELSRQALLMATQSAVLHASHTSRPARLRNCGP